MSTEADQIDAGQDLYDLLQVSPRAHPEVVNAAYLVLAQHYQPEQSEHPHAARYLRHINAAYAVLRDEGRRARYDAYRLRNAQQKDRFTPRPYSAAPALERSEPVLPKAVSRRKLAAAAAAVILALVGLASWSVEVTDSADMRGGNGSATSHGVQKRRIGELIIDVSRMTPGPCGPQFPGPMNPC